MQRLAGLVIVLALVAVPMVAAQGDELPRVFSGNTLTVRYPDGWGFSVDEEESITLMSDPDLMEDGPMIVHPGEVGVMITTLPDRWPPDDLALVSGYAAGSMMWSYRIKVGWTLSEPPELDTVEVSEYTSRERAVYEVWMTTSGPSPADMRIIGIEGPIMVVVITPRGEMDQHSETINAILAGIALAN